MNLHCDGCDRYWFISLRNGSDKARRLVGPMIGKSTAFLEENDIDYSYLCQEGGDQVFVNAEIYHAVINEGISVAEAINYQHLVVSDLPGDSTFCSCCKNNRRKKVIKPTSDINDKLQVLSKDKKSGSLASA